MLDFVVSFGMAGSLIFLAVHVISYSHYRRQVLRKGKVIEDRDFFQQMLALKCELHISRTIRPVEYYKAETPMIIGFIMPILVLPEEQYTEEELFFILKHKLVHLKRGDVYFKMLREHTENNDTGTKETENVSDRPEAEAVQREESGISGQSTIRRLLFLYGCRIKEVTDRTEIYKVLIMC